MMPDHSERNPEHQQEDHDRDDYTPDWLLLRHSCGDSNRNLLLGRCVELYTLGDRAVAVLYSKTDMEQLRADTNSNAQMRWFFVDLSDTPCFSFDVFE
jgi:hypothetical protein